MWAPLYIVRSSVPYASDGPGYIRLRPSIYNPSPELAREAIHPSTPWKTTAPDRITNKVTSRARSRGLTTTATVHCSACGRMQMAIDRRDKLKAGARWYGIPRAPIHIHMLAARERYLNLTRLCLTTPRASVQRRKEEGMQTQARAKQHLTNLPFQRCS